MDDSLKEKQLFMSLNFLNILNWDLYEICHFFSYAILIVF